MDLTIDSSDWKAPIVTKSNNDAFITIFGTAQDWFLQNLPALPSVDLQMGSLYFFLTTNLLMPGKNVFNVDSSVGLRIPQDFIIVGNVAAAV